MFVRPEGTRRSDASGAGFSLFEIMIVMVVVGVLLMILVPNASRAMQVWRLDGSVRMVSGKLMEARIDAIKRNRQSWLSINTSGQVQVQTTDDTPATIDVGFPGLLQQSVSFQSGAPAEVRYDSMGRPTVTRTIVIETADLQKTITVSATGRVTVN